MIEVVQGHILNERLDEIIRNATERLMLVSPYIRLHHRTVDALKLLKQTPEIRLTVCFGKAEGQYEKSFHTDALVLLKEMPNISNPIPTRKATCSNSFRKSGCCCAPSISS